jgi:hypothetical protein
MRSARVAVGVIAVTILASCGSNTPLEERAELQGFAVADVQDIIEIDEDVAYDSEAEQLASLQRGAKGWAACRDVLAAYRSFLESGDVPPPPAPHPADADIEEVSGHTDRFIDVLYSPLEEGDVEGFMTAFVDPLNCGEIPANETGDRSATIADVVEELGG